MRGGRARGHAGLRVTSGAVHLGGIGRDDVAARARERYRLAAGAHHGRTHRMLRRRVYREERMGDRPAAPLGPAAVGVALQTGTRVVGAGGILDGDSDAGVVRDHAVLRLAMAEVAAALGELDVRVPGACLRDLRAVARLAVSEMRSAGDGEGRPGEVGRVERRRPASMDVDALEEVVRMAEQALWRRTGRGLPRRAREPAVG